MEKITTINKSISFNKNVEIEVRDFNSSNKKHPHIMFGQIDNNYISVGLTTKVNKGSSSRNKNKNSNLTLWNQIMTHILEGKELFQTEEITQ